ncbi:MAG: serine acetyltransferase [Kiritimatiellae bacterium]|nr:serine acetyltransferase [Kiritimatiellia bacterium]
MFGYSDILWEFRLLCRHARWAPLRAVLVWLYDALQFLGGGWISHEAEFGGKPCLPHGIRGVFVSRYARVGRNCVIFQQVTIGSNLLPDSAGLGAPVVGDQCYIGAGAKIVGRVTVGARSRIGANAVVRESVPENGIAIAGAPVVAAKEPLNNRFYTRRKERWLFFDNGQWLAERDPAVLERLNKAFP